MFRIRFSSRIKSPQNSGHAQYSDATECDPVIAMQRTNISTRERHTTLYIFDFVHDFQRS